MIEPGFLGKCIVDRDDIWQMRMLKPSGLSSYAKDRDVNIWEDQLKQLWQLKLLRADLVISKRKLRNAGLIEVERNDQRYYSDERNPIRRRKGWTNATERLPKFPTGVELYFHPFRYYVLYELVRILKLNNLPFQMLVAKGYPRILESLISDFRQWSATPPFLQLVNRWNTIVSLAVLIEPCFYEIIFHQLRYSPSIGYDEQRSRIERHWEEIRPLLRKIGVDELEKMRSDLCFSAEMLDHNTNVHTLLRLSSGRLRQKLKDRLGGAVILLTMAEMLRRGTETEFNIKLPEEDEISVGIMPSGVKERIYGAVRILDNASASQQFIRSFDLDYGVQVRWYVEGDTEYGALDFAFSGFRSIEILNLSGNIVQKGKKGLAFVDNLHIDLDLKIFSNVMVDHDKDDTVRVVRNAIENDLICGMVYISDPDFEFSNFSLEELIDVIWDTASENGAESSAKNILEVKLRDVTSGKELEKKAKKALPELFRFSKGIDWGRRLMEYAWNNPEKIDSDGKTVTRPIVDAIQTSFQGLGADYLLTRKKFKVDIDTGKLIERGEAI